jgi:TPR repeat protein
LVGNPQAQYEYHRELRLQNLPLSLMWLRKAAEQGHSLAQFDLSKLYQTGNHSLFRKNLPLALKWLQMSAEQGYNEAQMDLANKFIQDGMIQIDIASGIFWCKKAADNNHLEAIIFLARCYSLGRYVTTNQDTAISYFRLAAQLNHLASMLELAKLLEARNHIVEAIQWYRILIAHQQHEVYYPLSQLLGETVEGLQCLQQAADRGVIDAQLKMVNFHRFGCAVTEININKAVYYAKMLADTHHQLGLRALVELLQQHETAQISEQEKQLYYKTAADQNHTASQYFYARSIFETHTEIAHYYFRKAAEANYSDAYYYFAFLEKQHFEEEAIFYFKKSIEYGKHVVQSKKECIKYYIKHNLNLELCLQLCAELHVEGETTFSFELARMLDTGIAGETNRQKALTIYIALADNNHSIAGFYAGVILSDLNDRFLDNNRARHYLNLCHSDIKEARLRLACLLLQEGIDIRLAENLLEEYCESFGNVRDERQLTNSTNKSLEKIIATVQSAIPYKIGHYLNYTPKIDFYLGKIFEEGLGTSVNLMRAFSHYDASAKADYLEGFYRLAYCFEHGIGTKRDWSSAKHLYQTAADRGHELAKKRLTWQYSIRSSFTNVNDKELKSSKDGCVIS